MEAFGDQLADGGGSTAVGVLAGAIASVNAAASAAPDPLAIAGYVEAADFAGLVEDLSRTVDYLQVLAAGAVGRTRTRAITAAATTRTTRPWVTGWDNGVETLHETDAAWPATGTPRCVPASPADDGCKSTAEFLRLRLRIGLSEAHRRIHLAHTILPTTTLTGDPAPPARAHLAAALTPATTAETSTDNDTGADADAPTPPHPAPGPGPALSSRAGTIISATLERLKHHTTAENLDRIEHDLTQTAATADPDFLTRVARRWAETIDADGTEPTEEALRHTQGAFIRKPRHGLHHLEIFATTDQYEHLATVMNTATNPRTTTPGTDTATDTATDTGTEPRTATGTETGTGAVAGAGQDNNPWQDTDLDLDRRTRSQKQLDGIIGALKAALTTNQLPTTGGNRPQILATINYQDLLPHHTNAATGLNADAGTGLASGLATGANTGTGTGVSTGTATGVSTSIGAGNFTFTGPVAATTLRKIACDADIIPALLGTSGEILDLGRKTRLFTPAQRLALTARDQGCTFPNCTIPAPWCEAHHITYWSHHGPTNVSNGALLCSHHHHLIHKEQWTINTIHGIPWFTPPRHIDPTQKPQQNHYFKPPPPPQRE